MPSWPIAIDPADCGCTECIIGQYVPLQYATAEQIFLMLRGALVNNTSTEFEVEAQWTLPDDFRPEEAHVTSVRVRARLGDSTHDWDITTYVRIMSPSAFVTGMIGGR